MSVRSFRQTAGAMAVGGLLAVACAAPGAPSAPPTPTSRPAAPVAQSRASPAPVTSPAASDQLARGEQIFQRTAGGVGCASCHGPDARGLTGPDIRGRSAEQIRTALNAVEAMAFISNLVPADFEALAAYLKTLETR